MLVVTVGADMVLPLLLPEVRMLLDAMRPLRPAEAVVLAAPADALGCVVEAPYRRALTILEAAGLVVSDDIGGTVYALVTRAGEAMLTRRERTENRADAPGGQPCLFPTTTPNRGRSSGSSSC